MSLSVVLVDVHPVVRHGLESLLQQSNFQVVASEGCADKAFFQVVERVPDFVIMGLELPGRGTFALTEDIRRRLPLTRIVYFTAHLSDVLIDEALRLGASGYILKTEPRVRIQAALETLARGESYFSPEVQERLEYDQDSRQYVVKSSSLLATLTVRQLQVLRHLVKGDSVKQVAYRMSLSERAVESHKYRIMQKLGIHDRVELTRFAIREGLVSA